MSRFRANKYGAKRGKTRVGQRYGRLTVVAPAEPVQFRSTRLSAWVVQCDCGKTKTVLGSNLSPRTKSCGCMRRGLRGLRAQFPNEYASWATARQRCRNPKNKSFLNYGGRGITFSPLWDEFKAFFAELGPRPNGMSLDRIENNRGYEPGNCRWASRLEQNRNKRPYYANRWRGTAGMLEGLL